MAGSSSSRERVMTRKERLRLFLLRTLAFFTFPVHLTKLQGNAKILLIRPDHLGDVLFTTPALRLLRETLPDAHITYMVGSWSRGVVANNPNVDDVLTCEFPGFTRRPKTSLVGPYLQLRREARRLRLSQFDVAVNLRFDSWWGAMLTYFADIPHRIGYATPETKPFLTLALPYLGGRHEVLQNIRLAATTARLVGTTSPAALDPEVSDGLEFHPLKDDEAFAEHWLSTHSPKNPLALIHPGTGSPVKLWRAEGFSKVADALIDRYGQRVLLTGAKSEERLVESIRQQMQHEPETLIGADIGQLASVLKRCRFAVGVDSGIMHLASAVGIPTVRLYGPVDDATFGPWGGQHGRHIVVKSGMDCIPCNRLDFKRQELPAHPCVESIEVAQVLAAVEKLLEGDR